MLLFFWFKNWVFDFLLIGSCDKFVFKMLCFVRVIGALCSAKGQFSQNNYEKFVNVF